MWLPDGRWGGQTAYVIGGGPSLRSFDWGRLRGRNTVGCNSAVSLGADVCGVTVFMDYAWWHSLGETLAEGYAGELVFVGRPTERRFCGTGVQVAEREAAKTLPRGSRIATHGNSGVAALHYALLQGAARVVLLGFDLQLAAGRMNWHELRYEPPQAKALARFAKGWDLVCASLRSTWPEVEVIQAGDARGIVSADGVDLVPRVSLDSV